MWERAVFKSKGQKGDSAFHYEWCRRLSESQKWRLLFRSSWCAWDSLTHLLPAGEAPVIGEALTLVRLHRLDGAHILPLQEDALPIGLIYDGEASAVGIDAGVALDEVLLCKPQMLGYGGRLCLCNAYVPRPAAAVPTALAQVVDGGWLRVVVHLLKRSSSASPRRRRAFFGSTLMVGNPLLVAAGFR